MFVYNTFAVDYQLPVANADPLEIINLSITYLLSIGPEALYQKWSFFLQSHFMKLWHEVTALNLLIDQIINTYSIIYMASDQSISIMISIGVGLVCHQQYGNDDIWVHAK